jgi:ATP synthase protein I
VSGIGGPHGACATVFVMCEANQKKQDNAPPRKTTSRAAHCRRQEDSPWSAVTLVTQLGLVVALCISGATALGVYLDRLVGSNGILVLVMIVIGLVAAGVSAWTLIKQELPWNR